MTREVYNSSTHGPIPLSFEGRRLMQNLRMAISDYGQGCREAPLAVSNERIWQPVSHARGELAKYISKLEALKHYPPEVKLPESVELVTLPSKAVTIEVPDGYRVVIEKVDRRL